MNPNIPNLNNLAKGLLTPGESLISTVCSQWASGSDVWPLIAKPVQPHHFVREWEKELWSVVLSFREQGIVPDIGTLYGAVTNLKQKHSNNEVVNNWFDQMAISAGEFTTQNVNAHVEHLINEWFSASVAKVETQTALIDNPNERHQKRSEGLEKINSDPVLGGYLFYNAKKTAAMMAQDWVDRLEGKGDERDVGFGFGSMEEVIFEKGCLAVVAGRAGMGKTTTLTNMIRMHKDQGKKIGVFTLEMTLLQLGHAMIAQMAGVSPQLFRNPQEASDTEYNSVIDAWHDYSSKDISIQESPGLSLIQLEEGIQAMKREHKGLDVVYIDHIHIMSEATNIIPARAGVTKISGTLKTLAKKHDVAIIAAAQMNREADKRDSKEPRIADLRESGSIEQDADIILMVYRDNYYETEGEQQPKGKYGPKQGAQEEADPATKIYVRKNRHGERNNFVKRFDVDIKTRVMRELE